MNTELQRIKDEALKLSVEERERLVESLIESFELPDQPPHGAFGGFATANLQKYWLDEAGRRLQQIRDGDRRTYPAEEVLANVRARLETARAVR